MGIVSGILVFNFFKFNYFIILFGEKLKFSIIISNIFSFGNLLVLKVFIFKDISFGTPIA